MNWSSRRIRRISDINNAENYLEIGVNRGNTFLEVDIEYKDGVDPNFLFDTDRHKSEKVRLFQQSSDSFWTSKNPKIYDVIFIDGLHTFEQTIRDLICSMRFSHDKTVWLIDDTLPSDVFSAIPNQDRSYRERKRMNLEGLPWHGDVFKVVPAIHDFFPVLSYATIVGSGNPQTLAWYSGRAEFKTTVNNWEAISRMTFFDIEPNRAFYRLMSEEEALEELRRGLMP